MVVVVFGGLIWVFWLVLVISVFTLLPPLNANREYYAYIESQREHFVLCTFVPAPPAAYSEGTLISRTLISSFYCIFIFNESWRIRYQSRLIYIYDIVVMYHCYG